MRAISTKFLFVSVLGLSLVAGFLFLIPSVRADSYQVASVDCEKHGSSRGCSYAASVGSDAAYRIDWSLAGDGFGAFGGSGGKVGLWVCFTNGAMWGGPCQHVLDDHVGDGYSCDSQPHAGNIGNTRGCTWAYFYERQSSDGYHNMNAEVYVNDAHLWGAIALYGASPVPPPEPPPPPAPGAVVCSPSSQSTSANTQVLFTASGGDGTYAWNAPGSIQGGDNDPYFNVSYATDGTYSITVSSAGTQYVCSLQVGDGSGGGAGGGGGGGGGGGCDMAANSAVRGCVGYVEWSPVYQPTADDCAAYCDSYNSNSCEWYAGNGDCYVEFGSGCYVSGGFSSWYASACHSPALPVSANILANGSDGPITIDPSYTTISWSSANATACTIYYDGGGWASGTGGSQSANTTTPGTYVFSITCSGPGGTASDSVTINTTQSFNYSLSNSGTSNVTKASGNAFTQNTITKTLLAGTTQAVSLTASGLPSGVSYSVSNGSCTPSCSSVITFTVTPSAPAGTFPITVTGSPLGKTTSFNLIITGAPISVTCAPNPSTALLGQNITWTGTVTGGRSPFIYSWFGSSIPTNPAPSANPYVKSYSTTGQKTAQLTVTDADNVSSICLPATVQINFNPSFEEF